MTSSSSTTTASETSSPSICAIGGSIGNTTIDVSSYALLACFLLTHQVRQLQTRTTLQSC
jgi:hypothetical protein